jgi:hypothetical protein
MSLTFWTPEQFGKQQWPHPPGFVWEPYIPTGGTVLLHGPRGASKSQLLWQLLNAVAEGSPLFGNRVQQGPSLLICVDMPPELLTLRFQSSKLSQRFDLIGGNSFNVYSESFPESEAYLTLAEASARTRYALVAIDATGRIHHASPNDNAAPNAVYAVFKGLFPNSAIVYNHHDHKRGQDRYGQEFARNDDDALGAVNWLNFANTVLHLYPTSESLLQLDYTKSQVARLVAPKVLYRTPETGRLQHWVYPTWSTLARMFSGFQAIGNMPLLEDARDLPELLPKLNRRPAFRDLTLGQLRGIFYGWQCARAWEREHKIAPYESGEEQYANGVLEETDNQQPHH